MLHNSSINPILYIASSRRRNILRNHIYDHRNNHCYNQYHNKYSCHKSFVFLITEINHNYLHNQYGQRGIHEKGEQQNGQEMDSDRKEYLDGLIREIWEEQV